MELQSDRSKKDIADALISLMKKKDFNKITNKDILKDIVFTYQEQEDYNNYNNLVLKYQDRLKDH